MHLISLKTENFKRLGTFHCTFTAGLNVIAGDNARGKSTLLQAIEAALFGTSVVPGKKESIPTWGQTKFKIVLEFEVKGATYELTRTPTTAKLIRTNTGEVVGNGNTPVTLAIEGLLGLAGRDWNLFVQSKQHEASGILTFGAAALNRKVEEFAGVDLIDKVQTEAQRKLTLHNGYAEAKAVSFEESDAAEKEADAMRSALQEAVQEQAMAMQAVDSLAAFAGVKDERDLGALRAQVAAANQLWQLLELAEAALGNARSNADAAVDRCKGLATKDVSALVEQQTSLKEQGVSKAAELKALEDKRAEYRKLGEHAASAFVSMTEAKKELKEAADAADANPVDAAYEAKQAAEAEYQAARDEVARVTKALKDAQALAEGAACPTCKRAFEDHNPEQLAAEVASLEQQLVTVTATLKAAAGKKSDADTRAARATQLQSEFDTANAKAERFEGYSKAAADAYMPTQPVTDAEIDTLATEISALRDQLAAVNVEVRGAKEHNDRVESEQAAQSKALAVLADAQEKCAQLNDQWEALPEPPSSEEIDAVYAAHKAYDDALLAYNTHRAQLELEVDSTTREVNAAHRSLNITDDIVARLKARQLESEADKAKALRYGRLVQFLRTRRQDYMRDVWDLVMNAATKLVRQSSQGEITGVSNDDGDFFYVEEGVTIPTTSASGAQKAMIGTALRVALGRALYGSDSLMIFDEPTESCKEHNAASMAATLATSAKQVLLITHRETDQALAENIISVGE